MGRFLPTGANNYDEPNAVTHRNRCGGIQHLARSTTAANAVHRRTIRASRAKFHNTRTAKLNFQIASSPLKRRRHTGQRISPKRRGRSPGPKNLDSPCQISCVGAAMSLRQTMKTPQSGQARGAFQTTSDPPNSTPLVERIKATFLVGKTSCAIDFHEDERAEALGAIAHFATNIQSRKHGGRFDNRTYPKRDYERGPTSLAASFCGWRPTMFRSELVVWRWAYNLEESRQVYASSRKLWRQAACCVGLAILRIVSGGR